MEPRWLAVICKKSVDKMEALLSGALAPPQASRSLPGEAGQAGAPLMKHTSSTQGSFLGPSPVQVQTPERLQLRAGNRPKVQSDLGTPWNQVWKLILKINPFAFVEWMFSSFSITVGLVS